jgi:hypothetical protein
MTATEWTAALQAHRRALDAYLLFASTTHRLTRSDAVTDAGREVLGVTSGIVGATTGVVTLTNHPSQLSLRHVLVATWPPHVSTYAVLLERGHLLLGYVDQQHYYTFAEPEPVDLVIGGHVVTVRTTTGRLLVIDAHVDVYRQLGPTKPSPVTVADTATPEPE